MSVKPIIQSLDKSSNINAPRISKKEIYSNAVGMPDAQKNNQVSFQGGINPVVSLMDFIEAGGFAVSFIIQDGLGFIFPRVTKGILRGGKEKVDENGKPILDKNGKPKHELNWQYARKEAIRELVTGPSAFFIPMLMLHGIKKWFGTGNNVKLNYLDGFRNTFEDFAQDNLGAIKESKESKEVFYKKIFRKLIDENINIDKENPISENKVEEMVERLTEKQLKTEEFNADPNLSKKQRNAKIAEMGSLESEFMKLKKKYLSGDVNEIAVKIISSDGQTRTGVIRDFQHGLTDYYKDAINSTKKLLSKGVTDEEVIKAIKSFTSTRMGTRILTNFGLFGAVAAFYTQIPKLYNLGLKGNPALANQTPQADEPKKEVSFTGLSSSFEKLGNKMFKNPKLKKLSDIYEFNGNIISGTAMPSLLYGFCIPPRLMKAQDEYDMGEIIVRDLTSFTTLLFGAKALARLFSDGFTKITGLTLNKKDLDNKNFFQKVIAYLNPGDGDHSVLNTVQLESKYQNIHEYKNGVIDFMDFLEKGGGNIKRAFASDKNVKNTIERIIGKSYEQATVSEIKEALIKAHKENHELMTDFYKLFKGDNGLLRRARTCNSAFGFASTIVFIPLMIWMLTEYCEKMTNDRLKKASEKNKTQNPIPSIKPIKMDDFINNITK